MIDKSLVKKRFSKSLKTYDDNAFIQKIMAKNLIGFLNRKEYDSILEIGSATGLLTGEIKHKIKCKHYYSNDLVEESKNFIDKIYENNFFIPGDIETITLSEKYDLIISNASLQWCNNLEDTISKLINSLNNKGLLAVSIFGENNLPEIKNIFNLDNKNYNIINLKQHLKKYKILCFHEEEHKLYFNSPADILKHIKLTGVNAIKEIKLTKTKFKNFEETYEKLYKEKDKYFLTYNPIYIVIENDLI